MIISLLREMNLTKEEKHSVVRALLEEESPKGESAKDDLGWLNDPNYQGE